MSTDDPTHRGDAPAPVDLAGHFKELGRALLPALLIAVVVGAGVFALRTFGTEKEYAASIVTEIHPAQTPVPGDAFIEQLRAPFMGLAQDTNVLNQVLSEVDTNWDAATLAGHVALSPGPSPQLLIFTVTAPSSDLAKQLVKSMVVTVAQAAFANHQRDSGAKIEQLQAAVAAEESANSVRAPDDPARGTSAARLADMRAQLDTLQSGGDSLSVLATPSADANPVSPQPVSEAIVAALAALIVSAELIVLWRGRVGSTPNRTWARRIAHRHRARFDAATVDAGELPPLLGAEIAQLQRDGRTVLVLQGRDARVSRSVAAPHASGQVVAAALDDSWWRHVDAADVALAVVLVSMGSRDRKVAEAALRQLDGLDVTSWLVLQHAGRGSRRGSADRATLANHRNGDTFSAPATDPSPTAPPPTERPSAPSNGHVSAPHHAR